MCIYPALGSSYKYMCIGNGPGQWEWLDLTVGAYIALGNEVGSIHAHGYWGYLWADAWQHGPTV